MNVLIVHNQLWAHYKSKLFSELHRLGQSQNVDVLVLQIARTEASRANMGDNLLHQYQYNYDLLFEDLLENVRFWPKFKLLFQKFRNFHPQVLNITGYYDPAQVLLMVYAKVIGCKVIISNESGLQDHSRQFLKEFLKKTIIKLADGFFCFGTSSANYLKILGAKDAQILTAHAAVVDEGEILRRFTSPPAPLHKRGEFIFEYTPSLVERGLGGEVKFIYIGRLIPPKNLVLLLKTFAKFQEKYKNWGLTFLGEGGQKAELMDICEKQKIPNITFISGKAWYEVPQYLALADVLVLPSVSEPWGLVVNEAMVCGMPVLVSKQCGCAEDLVQDGINGQTFDAHSETEFFEKMEWFAQNQQNFSSIGAFSKKIIAKFSSTSTAQEMIDGFRGVSNF